jgi:hypothetical protein
LPTRACSVGWRYISHQAISQAIPSRPVMKNAACQPNATTSAGTSSGVMIAPMFAPALNSPIANARSRCGNQSVTARMPAGKLPDSPMPSPNRAAAKLATPEAKPCAMCEIVQITIAIA